MTMLNVRVFFLAGDTGQIGVDIKTVGLSCIPRGTRRRGLVAEAIEVAPAFATHI